MSQLIETICILEGEIRHLDFHQKRLNRSRYKLLGLDDELDLDRILKIPENLKNGKLKCRIVYSEKINSIEFLPYSIRPIHSVKLVENNSIEYKYKLEDRTAFEFMKDSVAEDEIIIVKNGQITDTSYSNLVFFDGENWLTPYSYLLNGTMRQHLIQTKKIQEEKINPKDLNQFLSFKLINAMMDLDESPELDISMIC